MKVYTAQKKNYKENTGSNNPGSSTSPLGEKMSGNSCLESFLFLHKWTEIKVVRLDTTASGVRAVEHNRLSSIYYVAETRKLIRKFTGSEFNSSNSLAKDGRKLCQVFSGQRWKVATVSQFINTIEAHGALAGNIGWLPNVIPN